MILRGEYDVDKDIIDVLIESAEHKRCPVFLYSDNFGGQRAGCGLFLAKYPEH
jgi:hypothetical protein